jgi:hypothetical protein
MSLFYVWNPSLVKQDPPTLTFVLSTGDGDQIGRGTDEFIAGLLRDLQVTVPPVRWSLLPFRAYYFRDPDLSGPDWQDLWPMMWLATVEVPTVPMQVPVTWHGPRGTDANNVDDASFSRDDHWLYWPSAHCLVIADFANEEARARAKSTVIAMHQRGELTRSPSFHYGEAAGRYPTLYVDLGDRPNAFYESGAEEAERVRALLEKMGGTTHYLKTEDRDYPR